MRGKQPAQRVVRQRPQMSQRVVKNHLVAGLACRMNHAFIDVDAGGLHPIVPQQGEEHARPTGQLENWTGWEELRIEPQNRPRVVRVETHEGVVVAFDAVRHAIAPSVD